MFGMHQSREEKTEKVVLYVLSCYYQWMKSCSCKFDQKGIVQPDILQRFEMTMNQQRTMNLHGNHPQFKISITIVSA